MILSMIRFSSLHIILACLCESTGFLDINVNEYTSRESNSVTLVFASLFNRVNSETKKKYSYDQIFSFKS